MAHDVFISYSTADKAIADAVCATLERRSIRCWMAPRDIPAGANWGEAIIDAIKASNALVLVFSARANASQHISRELERAVSHEIPIIPIRIEDVLPHGSLEYTLATVHWLDAITPPMEAHISHLADTLRPMIDRKIAHDKQFPPTIVDAPSEVPVVAHTPNPPARVPPSRPPWLIPAIAGVTVLAVVAYYFASPGHDDPKTIADALARQNAERSSASAPQPSSTTPPTRASDPEREPFKTMALDQQRWFVCDDYFCAFTSLRSFFPAITRIRFGESASRLDRVIDLPPAAATFDSRQMQRTADRYVLQYIPIRPGAAEMYAQLEFYDGSISSVRPAQMPQPGSRRTTGIRLDAAAADAAGHTASLFVGYMIGDDTLDYVPDVPPGVTAVTYTAIGDPPRQARAQTSADHLYRGFGFQAPPEDFDLEIKYSFANGTEQGPFRYALRNTTTIPLNTFKVDINTDLDHAIRCKRIAFKLPADDAQGFGDNMRALGARVMSVLGSQDLSFVKSAPIVACIPGRTNGRGDLSDWSAVKEVRITTTQGAPGETSPVHADLKRALQRRLPSMQDANQVWNVLLPDSVQTLFATLVFFDGSVSREIRIPVDEIKLPPR